MTNLLLTNRELLSAQIGLAKAGGNERRICRAQIKKLVEWLKKRGKLIEDAEYAPQKQKLDLLIQEKDWQTLLREVDDVH